MSYSLWPHGLQCTRPPCPSLSPGVCLSLYPLSLWCYPTCILCHPLLLLPLLFPSIRVFSDESALHIRWPKYWSFSFSISPSNEYSRLVSFRMDWCDLLAVRGTLKSLLQHKYINTLIYLPHPATSTKLLVDCYTNSTTTTNRFTRWKVIFLCSYFLL